MTMKRGGAEGAQANKIEWRRNKVNKKKRKKDKEKEEKEDEGNKIGMSRTSS